MDTAAKEPTPVGQMRPLEVADLAWSAHLHHEVLAGGLFTQMGEGFLRAYHRTYVRSPHGIALVHLGADGSPTGFVLGCTQHDDHTRHVIRKQWAPLVLAATVAFVRHPRVGFFFLRTRAARYARKILRSNAPAPRLAAAAAAAVPVAPAGSADLSHLAVEPHAQGTGIGSVLLDHFAAAVTTAGAAVMTTWTSTAASFYERNGWTPAGTVKDFDGHDLTMLKRDASN